MTWSEQLASCVAHPCTAPRVVDSAFCKADKAIHAASAKSGYVKRFRELDNLVATAARAKAGRK